MKFRVKGTLRSVRTAESKRAEYSELWSTEDDIPMVLWERAVAGNVRCEAASGMTAILFSYPRRQREVVKLQEIGEYDTHRQTMMLQ